MGIMYSFMWALQGWWWWCQSSDPHDGPASILLAESSFQPTLYLHVCAVYVHLHLCACMCVVQACGDLKFDIICLPL